MDYIVEITGYGYTKIFRKKTKVTLYINNIYSIRNIIIFCKYKKLEKKILRFVVNQSINQNTIKKLF